MRTGRRDLRAIAFPVLLGLGILAAILLWPWVRGVLEQIDTLGAWAAPALLGVQVLQVVLFVIPGEVVQIAAGYLFGVVRGSALSLAGIALGSLINYGVGRALGAPFLELVLTASLRERIAATTRRRGIRVGFYLLFVIPGIPKDILGYVAGAAAVEGWGVVEPPREPAPGESRHATEPAPGESRHNPFGVGPFLALSMLGRTAGIVGSAMIGASAAAGYGPVAVALLVVSAVLLVVAVRNQGAIEERVSRVLGRSRMGRRH